MKNRSVAFAAFVVCAFILPRAASAQGVNAFDNPGFEEHSKFGAVKKGVAILPGAGYNTSGGMRIHPARKKLTYHFPTSFKPEVGKRYIFSVSYLAHGDSFAHLAWESYTGRPPCRRQLERDDQKTRQRMDPQVGGGGADQSGG